MRRAVGERGGEDVCFQIVRNVHMRSPLIPRLGYRSRCIAGSALRYHNLRRGCVAPNGRKPR
jgi:hypothetical protein